MKIASYLEKSPVHLAIENGRLLEKLIGLKLHDFNLSYYQSLILVALNIEGEQNRHLKNLTSIFPMSKGALSQAVSVLEGFKLVSKKDSSDKRSNTLVVTDCGKEIALKVMTLLEDYEQIFDKLVDIKELKNANSYLKEII